MKWKIFLKILSIAIRNKKTIKNLMTVTKEPLNIMAKKSGVIRTTLRPIITEENANNKCKIIKEPLKTTTKPLESTH